MNAPFDNRGFSLVEILVASVVALIMILAIATFQVNLSKENRAISQKMEMTDIGQQLGQVLANDSLCTCNVLGAHLEADAASVPPAPQATFHTADISPLRSACPLTAGAPPTTSEILAQKGQDLPAARYPLPVSGVTVSQLKDLHPASAPYPGGFRQYSGVIEIAFADSPGSGPQKLVRQIQPIRIQKLFWVDSNQKIHTCGSSSGDVIYQESVDANGVPIVVANRKDQSIPSVARCPDGSVAIGGGWRTATTGLYLAGCEDSYAAVMYNAPKMQGFLAYKAWEVVLLCRPYVAYAMCLRLNGARSP